MRYINLAHNRKASNALCTLVKREKVLGHDENCQKNVSDVEDSLVTSSRLPGRPQKRPDDRTSIAGVAVRIADGSQRTAGAADEQCLRCGCSSRSSTVVRCAADIGEPLHTVCTAPAGERPTSGGVHNSLELVCIWWTWLPQRVSSKSVQGFRSSRGSKFANIKILSANSKHRR